MLTFFATGCAEQQTATPEAAEPAAVAPQKQEAKQYAGKLLDKSNKAKVISIEVGQGDKAKTVMVKFDDKKTPLTLVGSRPAGRYAQDHLPGAISIPDDVLKEKKAEVLTKEKDKLLVFSCGGITCGLSPNSAKLARELGYTNVRVYLEGEPVWRKN